VNHFKRYTSTYNETTAETAGVTSLLISNTKDSSKPIAKSN
jgi:hypothetical protein